MKQISLFSILSLLILGACGLKTDVGQVTASQIARPAFMTERAIQTENFAIHAWERMHLKNAEATIYIEGAGIPTGSKKDRPFSSKWESPTPKNPVALHLASRDNSKNIAYLSRPCQYIKKPKAKGCDTTYWRENRFAPEVIEAYEAALDNIAAVYHITNFHVVGYHGGANIAAILAARNENILTLRTVAGNLNAPFVHDHTQPAPLADNAELAGNYGAELANVPQHHFIGAADEIVTPGVYHSYRQSVGLSDCIHYSLVQDADHTRGWVEKWPELIKLQPQCAAFQELEPMPPAGEIPDTGYKGVMKK